MLLVFPYFVPYLWPLFFQTLQQILVQLAVDFQAAFGNQDLPFEGGLDVEPALSEEVDAFVEALSHIVDEIVLRESHDCYSQSKFFFLK